MPSVELNPSAARAGALSAPVSGQAHPAKGHALPRYRADIDGLRAIAVLPVVFWHYGIAPFSGGFVGVDVFFVISGFLITSLIHGEMKAGTFSILYFYERRIRRIFPALFAMLAVSAALAAWLLFPSDLKRYAQSLQATVAFGSNFLFRNLAGYWDVVADRKPLLHTWSLAVEEQFYVLFPLTLFLLGKLGRRIEMAAIAAIFALSLAANVWAVRAAPVSDFFLLPYRAWELMIGAVLAIGKFPIPESRIAREILMALGAALIAFAIFTYTPGTAFPGWAAIAPCVGAALLIYAGAGESFTGAVLKRRPLVVVGLISYSLYLWHWPLLVFAKYALFRPLTPLETWTLIALSFLCAGLSWRFVEQPFRGRQEGFTRKQIFVFAAVAAAILFGIGAVLQIGGGLPQRFSPSIRAILAAAQRNRAPKQDGCIGPPRRFGPDAIECRFGSPAAKAASFILWGDSHAAVIMPDIAGAAIAAGRAGLFARDHGCAPLLGVASSRAASCKAFTGRIAKQIASDPAIRDVILIAHWAKSAEGVAYQHNDAGNVFLTDDRSPRPSLPQNHAVFSRGLERLVVLLTRAKKHVAIVASIPEVGWPVPETLARLKLAGSARDIRPALGEFYARQKFVLGVLARLHKKYGVRIVYPHRILCASGRCQVTESGIPIYVDAHHLTYRGAALLKPVLDPLIGPQKSAGD